jgi:hypothetical protein
MDSLFAFMVLASLVLLIIGFFKPQKSLFWYKKERTGTKSATIYGIALVASFVLFGITTDKNKSKNSSSGEISLSEAVSIAQEKANGSGQCQFTDVYKSVENDSGNYGILLSCGGGPKNYILYEINKRGEVMSAEFSD